MADINDCLRVGVITSPHGVRGEVKVYPTTDDIRRFDRLKSVFITRGGILENVKVTGRKYSGNMVILKLEGIDDRNTAELMREKDLYVERKDAVSLEPGEYFIADLVGCEVVSDEGVHIGELTAVIKTGANDVYSVTTPKGKEVLFPVIKDCILDVDIASKKVTVHVMKGLMED